VDTECRTGRVTQNRAAVMCRDAVSAKKSAQEASARGGAAADRSFWVLMERDSLTGVERTGREPPATAARSGAAQLVAPCNRILNHRGLAGNDLIAALAHLQLGRACAMQGEADKARAAFRDFLTL
jgi:hypothetical protein